MTLPVYTTGTVSVSNGGTTVIGSGSIWSGVNAKQGDFFARADGWALITEVTDNTHLKITPWPGATVSGGAYTIHQNYVGRVVGVAAAQDVADMLARLGVSMGPIFNVSAVKSAPDPSYGADGQYAVQITTGKWWLKSGGAWILTTGPVVGVPISIESFGASPSNSAATNTTAIQAAIDSHIPVLVPPHTYQTNSLSINNGNTKIYGVHSALSILTSAQTNTPIIDIAADLGNIEISDLGLTRSVTATAGGTGINFNGYVDTSAVRRCEIQKQYVGIKLSSTGYSWMEDCYVHNNRSDGVELVNTATNGTVQWYLTNNLAEANAGRGYIVIAVAGPGQVTLGDWINNYSFANSSFGMAFAGLSDVLIQGVRINGGLIGADGNSEIYLDTYGGQHKINNVFTELAGAVATGPGFATAASHVGSGIEITANNIDVTITNIVANGNSVHGLHTLATQVTNITGGRFANNSSFGVVIGDGAKATLNAPTFNGNTSGPLSVTANASSLIPTGCWPTSINGVLPVTAGGTGGTTQAAARTALGFSTAATANNWTATQINAQGWDAAISVGYRLGGIRVIYADGYTRLRDPTGNDSISLGSTAGGDPAIYYLADMHWFGTKTGVGKVTISGSGVLPQADNSIPCGGASNRWTVVYAATGTINTSDADEKHLREEPDDAVFEAILAVPMTFFQWNDAVDRKGVDGARLHYGPTAQAVRDELTRRGVDPARLALFCVDNLFETEFYDDEIEVEDLDPVEQDEAYVDADGQEKVRTATVFRKVGRTEIMKKSRAVDTGRLRLGLRLDQFDRLRTEAVRRLIQKT